MKYSAPPEYDGKNLKIQVFDDYIHVYSNTSLVTILQISTVKYNYHEEHYQSINELSFREKTNEIKVLVKENLKRIGDVYRE